MITGIEQHIILMTLAIKICYPHQVPVDRKCWPIAAADVNVVVQIPDRCLISRRIEQYIVRMTVVVKVSDRSPGYSVNGKDLVRIRRIYQSRGSAATWNVDFVSDNRCPDPMPW